MSSPLIGLPCDRLMSGPHPIHAVQEKYLLAAMEVAGCMAVGIPALSAKLDLNALLDRLDGLLITGAYSNIEPHHYGAPPLPGDYNDPARDALSLALIERALARGMPLLGICRGLQELNVARGGSLLQKVHESPGHMDHREDKQLPVEGQYAPAHPVELTPGGLLAGLSACPSQRVNSVHGQGIDRLGRGLRVEASAPDGLVEAVSLPEARGFALAVQWHPEWQAGDDALSRAIFQAFGDACRAYQRQKNR